MYVIIEKETNLVVGLTDNLIEYEDGSAFLDVNEDMAYYKGEYDYYSNVDAPGGINKGQYFYTPETGFKLLYSNLQLMKARMNALSAETEAKKYADGVSSLYDHTSVLHNQTSNLYNNFATEKANIESNIALLKENNLTADEKITLLETVVCDLFEVILTLQEPVEEENIEEGENTDVE